MLNFKITQILFCTFIFFNLGTSASSQAKDHKSTCYGTTANGKLNNGVQLPTSGDNFESYSLVAKALGRIYVHSEVKEILLKSYRELKKKYPSKVFKYAETGFREGGRFRPHKTHQNGLSVDHMVPVMRKGMSVHLPTNVFNKWGYDIEFDLRGNYKDYKLDYEALAALITELHMQSVKKGYDIWRVIFDPKMTPDLYKTSHGKYLKKNVSFTKKRSWVRHDEHIHVDFKIPCKL